MGEPVFLTLDFLSLRTRAVCGEIGSVSVIQ